jgi:hypothetical protein
MTPNKFIKSLKSLKTGDMGFCAIASVSLRKKHIIDNVGFWFEVIENEIETVLLVQMDSFTFDKPVKPITVTGKEQIYWYIENLKHWAMQELMSFFYLAKPSVVKPDRILCEHSLSA